MFLQVYAKSRLSRNIFLSALPGFLFNDWRWFGYFSWEQSYRLFRNWKWTAQKLFGPIQRKCSRHCKWQSFGTPLPRPRDLFLSQFENNESCRFPSFQIRFHLFGASFGCRIGRRSVFGAFHKESTDIYVWCKWRFGILSTSQRFSAEFDRQFIRFTGGFDQDSWLWWSSKWCFMASTWDKWIHSKTDKVVNTKRWITSNSSTFLYSVILAHMEASTLVRQQDSTSTSPD